MYYSLVIWNLIDGLLILFSKSLLNWSDPYVHSQWTWKFSYNFMGFSHRAKKELFFLHNLPRTFQCFPTMPLSGSVARNLELESYPIIVFLCDCSHLWPSSRRQKEKGRKCKRDWLTGDECSLSWESGHCWRLLWSLLLPTKDGLGVKAQEMERRGGKKRKKCGEFHTLSSYSVITQGLLLDLSLHTSHFPLLGFRLNCIQASR